MKITIFFFLGVDSKNYPRLSTFTDLIFNDMSYHGYGCKVFILLISINKFMDDIF